MNNLTIDENPTNSLDNPRTPKEWKTKICVRDIKFWKAEEIENNTLVSKIPLLESELHKIDGLLNREIEKPKNREEYDKLVLEINYLNSRKKSITKEIAHIRENVPKIMIDYYQEILNNLNGTK